MNACQNRSNFSFHKFPLCPPTQPSSPPPPHLPPCLSTCFAPSLSRCLLSTTATFSKGLVARRRDSLPIVCWQRWGVGGLQSAGPQRIEGQEVCTPRSLLRERGGAPAGRDRGWWLSEIVAVVVLGGNVQALWVPVAQAKSPSSHLGCMCVSGGLESFTETQWWKVVADVLISSPSLPPILQFNSCC